MSFWGDAAVLKRINALDRQITALRLDTISALRLLHKIIYGALPAMAHDLTALQTAVAADTDATNSALTLIQGIATQLKAAQGDPAKLQALVDQLNANAAALAAAVAANTPADPTDQSPPATP